MRTKTLRHENTVALSMGLLAATFVAGLSGCAGDRYTRSTGEYIDDHSLEMRADRALSDNPDYKFGDVKITTFKGVVQLNGFVDTADQKSKAGDIVKAVPGVREVDNNIDLAARGARTAEQAETDKQETARIHDALYNNPEYKFDGVQVAVYEGVVQLSGFVDTTDQKGKATDIAKQTSGASDVENNIMSKDRVHD